MRFFKSGIKLLGAVIIAFTVFALLFVSLFWGQKIPAFSQPHISPLQVSPKSGVFQQICPALNRETVATVVGVQGEEIKPQSQSRTTYSPEVQKLTKIDGSLLAQNNHPDLFATQVLNSLPTATAVMSLKTAEVSGGSFSGLAATSCQQPANHFYFLVPANPAGTSSLELASSNLQSSTVTLRAWSQGIELMPPRSLILKGNEKISLQLGSITNTTEAYILEVEVQGPGVSSVLYTNQVNGITPQGSEWSPSLIPQKGKIVIPGYEVSAAGGRLLLANTSKTQARVSIKIAAGEKTIDLPGGKDLLLEGKSLLDLDLAGLSLGSRSFYIESDKKILVSAVEISPAQSKKAESSESSNAFTKVGDYALVQPAQKITSGDFTVPDDFLASLVLAAGDKKTTVSVGKQKILLNPSETKKISVSSSVELKSDFPFYAQLRIRPREEKNRYFISTIAVNTTNQLSGKIIFETGVR
ncbi:hypothetical protein KRX54_06745 [Actinomycetaceae bacterium TAE3-ERU4]|nr:hypothetical protein [Actinomycetaceae bacterium TAE3-ERU4]